MKPYKILIFRVSSLGDFIHATPAIKLIRKNNPGAKIYFSSQKKKSVGFVTPDLLPFQKQIIDEFIFYNNNYLSFLFFFLKFLKKNLINFIISMNFQLNLEKKEIICFLKHVE